MSSKPKWSTRVDRVKLEETDEVVGEIMKTSALRFGLVVLVGIVLGRTVSNITHTAYLFNFARGNGCYGMRKHQNIKVSRSHRMKTATDSLRQICGAPCMLVRAELSLFRSKSHQNYNFCFKPTSLVC